MVSRRLQRRRCVRVKMSMYDDGDCCYIKDICLNGWWWHACKIMPSKHLNIHSTHSIVSDLPTVALILSHTYAVHREVVITNCLWRGIRWLENIHKCVCVCFPYLSASSSHFAVLVNKTCNFILPISFCT